MLALADKSVFVKVELISDIDDIRAEIMRLENERVWIQRDWARVLLALYNAPTRRADAVRRMNTAHSNAVAVIWR